MMNLPTHTHTRSFRSAADGGFSLVEVLVASAILMFTVGTLILSYLLYFQIIMNAPDHLSGSLLAHEGVEVMRILRDDSWSTVSSLEREVDHALQWDGDQWSVSPGSESIDDVFERSVAVYDVYRNGSDEIVEESAGSLDENTVMVTVTVSWSGVLGSSSAELSSYVTNMFDE